MEVRQNTLGVVSFVAAAAFAGAGQAQTASTPPSSGLQIEEVVVTAQRSEQNLQDVPISVTAVQSEVMEALQIVSTRDLDQLVPGLIMNRKANAVQPFVRGIGASTSAAGVEAPVATYVDGVYIPTPAGATFDLPDVERVEVLKGPQGTLWGRNATSGALNVVTRAPGRTRTLEAEAGYASYDTIHFKAYAAGPLGDSLRASLSFYLNDQNDGWGEVVSPVGTGDDFRKLRVLAGRGKLVWNPSSIAEVELGAFYIETKGDLTMFASMPGVLHRVPSGPNVGRTYVNPGIYDTTRTTPFAGYENEHFGGSIKGTLDLGRFDLINTAAYQKLDARSFTPIFGGIPFPQDPVLMGLIADETYSDEIRLQYASPSGNRLVLGAFYLKEFLRFGQFNFNDRPPPYTGGAIDDVTTKSRAVFADGSLGLGGGFSVTGGVRYTADSRALTKIQIFSATTGYSTFARRRLETSKTTYRVVGQWQASDAVMVYASQSTGYKAGFLNLGGAAPTAPALDPETLTAREIGLKSELFDRRVRLNVAAFRNAYSNVVVQQTVTIGGFVNTLQQNAARARTQGVEAEFSARVTEGLTLAGGVAYMPTAKYTRYENAILSSKDPATGLITTRVGSATGNRLIQAPKVEAQLQAIYSTPTPWGGLDLAGNVAYRSRIYLLADNRLSQDAVALFNASVTLRLPGDHLSLSLWGRNLTDEEVLTDAVNSGGVDITIPGSPRTLGVTLKADF